MEYDIIGDIHGFAGELIALLGRMGYAEGDGAWRHPTRKAIFVGDFIDRGPEQVKSYKIARQMVEAGSALAVMGNHEFNAIAWHTPDPDQPGEFLRPHFSPKYRDKNRSQHAAFLGEVEDKPKLHREIIDWFLTLPLWLDLPELRVVHACWHLPFMEHLSALLSSGERLSEGLLVEATREPEDEAEKDTPDPSPFKAVEALTKGIEIPLPDGHRFKDMDGHERTRVRVRWWDANAQSYKQAALLDDNIDLPDIPIPEHALIGCPDNKPLFFGHYWFTGTPTLLSDKVACIDYSAGKGGPLVAYRWSGEETLSAKNFCSSR